MSSTRIHAIKKINNYRIFQGWESGDDVKFGRVNLIYGQNGSGKSTFASLLADCAANTIAEPESRGGNNDENIPGLQLLVTRDTGQSSFPIDLSDREFWGRIRVFNKDFVHRNLRFEEPKGPQPKALLTIGERLAEAEEQLKSLRTKRDKTKDGIPELENNIKAATNQINKKLQAVARQVVEDLRTSPVSRYQATHTYTKRNVRKLLEDDSFDPPDASTDLAADRKRATDPAMRSIALQPQGALLGQDALNNVHELLSASVVSNMHIRELDGHPDRSKWVQEGISLHPDLEKCLFCGQMLTSDRVEELNAHFNESFRKLQDDIDDLVSRLEESAKKSKIYMNALPPLSDVYEDLREDLQSSCAIYKTEHNAYVEAISDIVSLLKEKRENPFTTPALSSELALTAPSVVTLESIVDRHQAKIKDHDREAEKAAERVERYHVSGFLEEYKQLKDDLEQKENKLNRQKTTVEDLERRIITLENVDGDPIPGSEELTKGLRGLLGRDELTFSANGTKHYIIERAGTPATHLSEGEQTAIALLYFLSSVRKDKVAGNPPIIIIDDPVSSLDHGILFGASAHIWSELVVNTYASQVFLLTHNFDFFRQWLIQMEAVPKKRREGGYMAYHIRTHVDDHGRRCPVFEVWELDDDRRKKMRSQYHFFFDQVATTLEKSDRAIDSISQMEAAALVPNTARKLLEGFLSFRTPTNMGKLHESVRATLDTRRGLDDSVRTMVIRYAHAYSHLEEADPTKPLEPNESVPFLHALFTFMDHVDSEHFTSMCKALNHNPDVLRGTSSSSAGETPV
ncbi:AAA family ATPase [Actinomyces wuliandei]|uniref:AAA family ATPase n=1 Tax=Actinomyces wuliandei TaxID=2057743 RepID=UPI00111822E0|nr:AAA family ATPase [Actinomyces wuliandei]